jgi:hypothetical protein
MAGLGGRLALAVALAGAMHAAQAAGWVRVGPAAKKGDKFFVDKAGIVKAGKQYKVWTMVSYARPQALDDGGAYLAMKALHLYSCEDRTVTLRAKVYFSDALGKTAPLQNVKYEKFTADEIVPDSVQEHALQLACPKETPPPPAPVAPSAPAKPAF